MKDDCPDMKNKDRTASSGRNKSRIPDCPGDPAFFFYGRQIFLKEERPAGLFSKKKLPDGIRKRRN